ncbi:hypothetical protein CRUP_018835, partial [Coryphaenoides rupestris]
MRRLSMPWMGMRSLPLSLPTTMAMSSVGWKRDRMLPPHTFRKPDENAEYSSLTDAFLALQAQEGPDLALAGVPAAWELQPGFFLGSWARLSCMCLTSSRTGRGRGH